jgi:tRNA pseudouridine55 synthase
MFGLLNINKPAGVTSRDVVNHVQRVVRPNKCGHAGTLDPLATGVLVVCIGPATRLIEYVQRMPKQYVANFLLGRESETEDVEGNVVELADAVAPSREQLRNALPAFIGEIDQRPPAFSAVKLQGQRAYALARRGQSIELPPRKIVIHNIQLLKYDYPQLMLSITCGSGTYVRSLGRDLAAALGTVAVMSALVRTAIGSFRIEEAYPMGQLTPETISQYMLPASRAVADLPVMQLTDAEHRDISHGRTIENRGGAIGDEIAALDHDGQLVAILAPRDHRWLRPVRYFASE